MNTNIDRVRTAIRAAQTAAFMGAALILGALQSPVLAGDYSGALDGYPGYIGTDADGMVTDNNYVNPYIIGWASEVVDYSPSSQTINSSWTDSSKALGYVAGSNTDIVSLGDMTQAMINDTSESPGSITLGFGSNCIENDEGYDFVLFENGFVSLSTGLVFAELGYVEVSTNGTDFVRFPSDSQQTASTVGAYGTIDPTEIDNLVGKHVNAYGRCWGTPFDLDDLVGMTDVSSGLVNLDDINYVRVVDIPGSGDFTDKDGEGIYDAWVTYGSGGVDLEACGIIHGDVNGVAFETARPGAVSTLSDGDESWINTSDVLSIDDLRTSCCLEYNEYSDTLVLSNFGFDIPTGATVNGILVRVEANSDGEYVQDCVVQLMKAGSAVGSSLPSDETWGNLKAYNGPFDEVITHGSETAVWGTTWTAAEINATGFGVHLSAMNTSATTDDAKIDYVEVAVFYTE